MTDFIAPEPGVDLPEGWVMNRLRTVINSDRPSYKPSIETHGVQAIDLTVGQKYDGRQLRWFDAFPVLERLAEQGKLVRVIGKGSRVPYYREIGS